ncbi:TnsA-like heteromeric transposase endonuclease subunit [Streptomyces sp. SBT349]|uniref:TnsA-like heteromeric transposase endonuclease subunit n=1 Tax=Streptomyces sp. SBT349 TaxID=1580539 RepID=UPI00099DE720|nr:TnsA-like heteromeric transposase endonuclease subunit [Streptomyces sp. SBT349]
MAGELQVLHEDSAGVRRTLPIEQMAGVPLAERGEVWRPSRHPTQRSKATWWWAATNRRLVGCRSESRLWTALVLDFHPSVVDFGAWCAELVWRERGRERRLVPDFFVQSASGKLVVVNCSPATGPKERFERQQEVLREACGRAGWVLAAPLLPSATALTNLRWVSRRRHPRFGDAQVEAALVQAFAQPRPLLDGVDGCGVQPKLVMPRLYHMLWHRRLGTDWEAPLGPDSLLVNQDTSAVVRSAFAAEAT